jgi:hypothetical protein
LVLAAATEDAIDVLPVAANLAGDGTAVEAGPRIDGWVD